MHGILRSDDASQLKMKELNRIMVKMKDRVEKYDCKVTS